jgi:hypothetical protein
LDRSWTETGILRSVRNSPLPQELGRPATRFRSQGVAPLRIVFGALNANARVVHQEEHLLPKLARQSHFFYGFLSFLILYNSLVHLLFARELSPTLIHGDTKTRVHRETLTRRAALRALDSVA